MGKMQLTPWATKQSIVTEMAKLAIAKKNQLCPQWHSFQCEKKHQGQNQWCLLQG